MTCVLHCAGLAFGRHQALTPPLDWDVNSGEFWAVVGPNGCGKSTLINTILGLLPKQGGVTTRTRACAHVAQVPDEVNTAPARVYDVVAVGLERGKTWLIPFFRRRHREKIDAVLEAFELGALKHRAFVTLSPGERQRVLLAQALVGEPELIVLDEAASAMDPGHAETTFLQLARLARQKGIAVIAITHQLDVQKCAVTHILRFVEHGFEFEMTSSGLMRDQTSATKTTAADVASEGGTA